MIATFLMILTACNSKSDYKTSDNSSLIDTTITLLKSEKSIPIDYIRALDIIDTTDYPYSSKGNSFIDTTVQLTNDIFYSIVNLPDRFGLCSYCVVLTIDEKKKKAIASELLIEDCDVYFSSDTYNLSEYFIIDKNTILVRETTTYQKVNRTSTNEEEYIDHKEIEEYRLHIDKTGKITSLR